jgi:hypothetical protein
LLVAVKYALFSMVFSKKVIETNIHELWKEEFGISGVKNSN